jgi:hypothetical protein
VEGQENIQEILSKQLYLCQFLVALLIVRTGKHILNISCNFFFYICLICCAEAQPGNRRMAFAVMVVDMLFTGTKDSNLATRLHIYWLASTLIDETYY